MGGGEGGIIQIVLRIKYRTSVGRGGGVRGNRQKGRTKERKSIFIRGSVGGGFCARGTLFRSDRNIQLWLGLLFFWLRAAAESNPGAIDKSPETKRLVIWKIWKSTLLFMRPLARQDAGILAHVGQDYHFSSVNPGEAAITFGVLACSALRPDSTSRERKELPLFLFFSFTR